MFSSQILESRPSLAIELESQKGRSPLFSLTAICEHLRALDYPESSIDSMFKCGEKTGRGIGAYCDVSDCADYGKIEKVHFKYDCNLRFCARCSKKRQRRLRRQFLPILNEINETHKKFLYFLTISPENYDTLEEGFEHIKKTLKKFMRNKYIKDRIEGGLYVIETKQHWKGQERFDNKGNFKGYYDKDSWNIHVHAIVYGQYIDNKIRGKCLNCKQTAMKKDYLTNEYYCASKKCSSRNVKVKDFDSKIVQIFRDAGNRKVNMRVDRLTEAKNSCENMRNKNKTDISYTLNYLLKYISCSKENFKNPESMAEYINFTRKKKLIVKFGSFHKKKVAKQKHLCFSCGNERKFMPIDMDLAFQKMRERDTKFFVNRGLMPPPPLPVFTKEIKSQKKLKEFYEDDFLYPESLSVDRIYDFIGEICS